MYCNPWGTQFFFSGTPVVKCLLPSKTFGLASYPLPKPPQYLMHCHCPSPLHAQGCSEVTEAAETDVSGM